MNALTPWKTRSVLLRTEKRQAMTKGGLLGSALSGARINELAQLTTFNFIPVYGL